MLMLYICNCSTWVLTWHIMSALTSCLLFLLHNFLIHNFCQTLILRGHVSVAPTPDFVTSVTCALNPLLHHGHRNCLQVVCPTDPGTEVNEVSSWVDTVVPDFGSFIIPGKYMVKIMPTFAKCE